MKNNNSNAPTTFKNNSNRNTTHSSAWRRYQRVEQRHLRPVFPWSRVQARGVVASVWPQQQVAARQIHRLLAVLLQQRQVNEAEAGAIEALSSFLNSHGFKNTDQLLLIILNN
ncbi:hypothetical protein G9A89_008938 [Geosiphon pyriformis]|nr:hypothetical protein G9A89_008938 [Geosiphon pyriformis]